MIRLSKHFVPAVAILTWFVALGLVLAWRASTSVWAEEVEGVGTPRTFTGAIGVQVFRNQNRLDPLAWYQTQDFPQGSPQRTTVDGYPGLDEGTSVYVSAPNYVHANAPGTPTAYVNVYLLSYGQGSDPATIEIARRLRQNWQFLHSLPVDVVDGPALAREKLRRDNDRLTSLGTLVQALQRYRSQQGSYPVLAGGTYLPGQSVSTWPSWRGVFSSALGLPAPTDPINSYDSTYPYSGPSECDTAQGFAAETCFASPGTPGGGATGAYECPTPASPNDSGVHVFEYRTGSALTQLFTNFEFKSILWPSGLPRSNVNVGSANDCRSYLVDLDDRGPSWGSAWPVD